MEAHNQRPYGPPSAAPEGRCAVSSAGGNGHRLGEQEQSHPKEAAARIPQLIAEAKEYAAYFLSAKIDGIKLSVRNLGIYAGLGIIGFVAFSALITTAVVLLLIGVSAALSHLFTNLINPKWAWLGPLLVGLILLSAIGVGAWIGLKRLSEKFRQATVQKYEQRQNWERGQFGHNVKERADANAH